jgi:hypothetical protein
MAFIRLKNGKSKVVSPDQGAAIWRILNGEERGSQEQRAFCKTIYRVYLSPHSAPPTYLEKYHPAKEPVMALPYKD